MKHEACVWCSAIVTVPDDYDPLQQKAVCGSVCKWAETLFCQHYSDDEIIMRRYFLGDEWQ
jgi:hypothetical protein